MPLAAYSDPRYTLSVHMEQALTNEFVILGISHVEFFDNLSLFGQVDENAACAEPCLVLVVHDVFLVDGVASSLANNVELEAFVILDFDCSHALTDNCFGDVQPVVVRPYSVVLRLHLLIGVILVVLRILNALGLLLVLLLL
jgi:hypothetical protein